MAHHGTATFSRSTAGGSVDFTTSAGQVDWVTSQDWFGFAALDQTGLGECMSIRPISGGFDAHHCIYIYMFP